MVAQVSNRHFGHAPNVSPVRRPATSQTFPGAADGYLALAKRVGAAA